MTSPSCRSKVQDSLTLSRKTWFSKIQVLFGAQSRNLASMWDELEELLISADVGPQTTTKLMYLAQQTMANPETAPRGPLNALKTAMLQIVAQPIFEDMALIKTNQLTSPKVILLVGVNGVGKTTTAAKLAHLYRSNGQSVIFGAADTFRAGAIEQLKFWAAQIDVQIIAHKQRSDPGAVAFDALEAAKTRGTDILIIDTAGRLHTQTNLMAELRKISSTLGRIDPQAPHQVFLVLDASVGQNGLIQARQFTSEIGCTGVILTKIDGTAKGGILLSIMDQLNLPVCYIGVGERLQDLIPFDPFIFVEGFFPENS